MLDDAIRTGQSWGMNHASRKREGWETWGASREALGSNRIPYSAAASGTYFKVEYWVWFVRIVSWHERWSSRTV